MLKLSAKQLDSIVRLQNEPDFGVFVDWLKNSRVATALRAAHMSKSPECFWMQGWVQQLGFILDAIESSKKDLEAVENNKDGQ